MVTLPIDALLIIENQKLPLTTKNSNLFKNFKKFIKFQNFKKNVYRYIMFGRDICEKIPVERRKISRAEWRGQFSLKTGIFRKYPSQT